MHNYLYYLYSTTCNACTNQCANCTSASVCTSCVANASFNSATSSCQFNSGYTPVNGACSQCPSSCAACSSLTNCLTCNSNAEVSSNGLCSCKSGFSLDSSNNCIAICNNICTSLSTSNGQNCTACITNAELSELLALAHRMLDMIQP
ncbi:unnamed protein product [Blepharisma stoltei]|uniref:Uncharacterized protein n=1 Tax=Blepharisma stoltei TaxID=1481888 RepID=A0AAU9JQZ8_9CILI|nr:unnamed protein product [Blepharisma stoltei]